MQHKKAPLGAFFVGLFAAGELLQLRDTSLHFFGHRHEQVIHATIVTAAVV